MVACKSQARFLQIYAWNNVHFGASTYKTLARIAAQLVGLAGAVLSHVCAYQVHVYLDELVTH